MGTDSFQNMVKKHNCVIWICIKIEDIYKDIAEDVETRFNTSNHELIRQVITKNKK